VLTSVAGLRLDGVITDRYDDLLDLPTFVADQTTLPPQVLELYERLERADAVLISTPEYAGGLPGGLKNLLDWVVGGGQMYGKPVAWLDVANVGRGGGARAQLENVLGYVGARVVRAACVRIDLDRGPEGRTVPSSALPLLRTALTSLAASVDEAESTVHHDDVRIEEFTGARHDLRTLFELAEDSPSQLESYLQEGHVLVARRGGQVVGHLQLVESEPGEVELKSMAVCPAEQRRGVGRRLVAAAVDRLRSGPSRRLVVATAAADIGNLRFYQRQGFRMRSVERDAFTSETGYPTAIDIDGIRLRDRVWLDRSLAT
jgi:NAD(P)H-dependent FMN reductase/GNAT superfamily N-acetyltransferase